MGGNTHKINLERTMTVHREMMKVPRSPANKVMRQLAKAKKHEYQRIEVQVLPETEQANICTLLPASWLKKVKVPAYSAEDFELALQAVRLLKPRGSRYAAEQEQLARARRDQYFASEEEGKERSLAEYFRDMIGKNGNDIISLEESGGQHVVRWLEGMMMTDIISYMNNAVEHDRATFYGSLKFDEGDHSFFSSASQDVVAQLVELRRREHFSPEQVCDRDSTCLVDNLFLLMADRLPKGAVVRHAASRWWNYPIFD